MYKQHQILFIGIVLLYLVIQILALFFLGNPNDLYWADANLYYKLAIHLSQNEPYSTIASTENLRVAPGYPFFLSLLIRVLGDSIIMLKIIHILLSSILIISIYFLTKLWIGQTPAIIAIIISCFYPYYIYIPATLYSESLSLPLIPLAFLLTYKLKRQYSFTLAIALSVLIAFLLLLRPTFIYLLLIVEIYLFWDAKAKFNFLKFVKRSFILCFIPFIAVTGWMYRNYDVHGAFFFSAGNSHVLFQTYNEKAVPGEKDLSLMEDIPELKDNHDWLKISKIYSAHTKDFISKHPLKSLKIASLNILNYWNPIPKTYTKNGLSDVKVKLIPAFAFFIILILGIWGAATCKKNKLFLFAVFLLLVLNTLLNAPFMVSVRYRLIVDFVLIIFASNIIYLKILPIFKFKKQ